MPDTPFKSMSREWGEKLLIYRDFRMLTDRVEYKSVPCEKCGGRVGTGDWPWCRGNAEDHVR